jgi:hypothetical protein
MEELFVLSKFQNKGDINPTEQRKFCKKHYEEAKKKEDLSGYELRMNYSSTPSTWCEICSPDDWGAMLK